MPVAKHIKLFLASILITLLSLSSCKKDDSRHTTAELIVGIWTPSRPPQVKFYDVVTGKEILNPGFDIESSPTFVFNSDNTYSAGSEKGTYNFDKSTYTITLKQVSGDITEVKVITLDKHNLTVEGSLALGNTSIVINQSYTK